MSHWTLGTTRIKDKDLLEEVAMDLGLVVEHKTRMEGEYAGAINCEFVVSDGQGGELAIVGTGDGNYAVKMDNYFNSICDVVGDDGALLTREYQVELHKREALAMGGVIASQTENSEGFVFLEVSI